MTFSITSTGQPPGNMTLTIPSSDKSSKKETTGGTNTSKDTNSSVTAKCREAKEKWMDENSAEIEAMMIRNSNEVYAKVKKLQYNPKTKSNIVRDKEGNVLFDNEKVAERWKEYMEELYSGEGITEEN
ncbi:hypothetical protein M8J77_006570 [Diaphorina citri]|nr:hypothetical protein M8J77_006570 [Diaphorina citri]